jgi:hypothetical protein
VGSSKWPVGNVHKKLKGKNWLLNTLNTGVLVFKVKDKFIFNVHTYKMVNVTRKTTSLFFFKAFVRFTMSFKGGGLVCESLFFF